MSVAGRTKATSTGTSTGITEASAAARVETEFEQQLQQQQQRVEKEARQQELLRQRAASLSHERDTVAQERDKLRQQLFDWGATMQPVMRHIN